MTTDTPKMTPEKQQIKIAEACGWNRFCSHKVDGQTVQYGHPPNYTLKYETPLYDYLNNLNAMHEAEISVFSDSGMQRDYSMSLIRVIKEQSHLGKSFFSDFDLAHATARQRAEAFLRTLGKWEAAK